MTGLVESIVIVSLVGIVFCLIAMLVLTYIHRDSA